MYCDDEIFRNPLTAKNTKKRKAKYTKQIQENPCELGF
jgi:hypothetical protein